MDNILFQDLEISGEIKRAIHGMGFVEATEVQSQSLMPILRGEDVIAQAPTGTGKTCAFGIPLIEKVNQDSSDLQGLILCPTRELVIQTTDELFKLTKYKKSIRIVPIYGGQNIDRQIMALKRKPQIIVATPGRLMDHMRRHTIRLEDLAYLALDEADEMLNMGFREDIDEILKTVPKTRQTVLFSATLSKEILKITNQYLTDPTKIQITRTEITVPSIEQYYLEVNRSNKLDVLARLIDVQNFKLSIVFCNTKRMVDELAQEMIARGYNAEPLHGDMRQQQRDRVMKKFKDGELDMLVATDVAARGIDIDDIEAVFNYDLPTDLEYYVHRIGRTGRANRKGVSYTFVSRREMYKLREIMNYTKAKIKLMKIPKVSEIEEIRTTRELEEIMEIIQSGKHNKCASYIEKFLEEREEEITILDIAAAFLSRAVRTDEMQEIEYTSTRDKKEGREGRSRRPGERSGEVRLFLNIGRLDKVKKKQISELLKEKCHVDPRKVSQIDVMEKFTFINIPKDSVNKVLRSLNGMKYNGRKMNVEIANSSR